VAELAERENECKEANKDAEELADLVRTKEEVIKTLQSKLAEAKKKMADLKAEIVADLMSNSSSRGTQTVSPPTASQVSTSATRRCCKS